MKYLVAAVAAVCLLVTPAASACDCTGYASAAAQTENSDAIFRGRAISTTTLPYADRSVAVTTFEVIAPLLVPDELGRRPQRIQVIHDCSNIGARCSITFNEGEVYLVAATYDHRHRLTTSQCHAPRWNEAEYRAALRTTVASR
jgi:hypothetical protein